MKGSLIRRDGKIDAFQKQISDEHEVIDAESNEKVALTQPCSARRRILIVLSVYLCKNRTSLRAPAVLGRNRHRLSSSVRSSVRRRPTRAVDSASLRGKILQF